MDKKAHWENIYTTKQADEVSWYQPGAQTSVGFVNRAGLSSDARIIDIGGGDSYFAEQLLDNGFEDITVVDISAAALERAKERLGSKAAGIIWIVADAANFEPPATYDFWHDRAAFHFLTDEADIENYLKTAHAALKPGGTFVLGTFSEEGPKKCSGIEIKQYSEASMQQRLAQYFERVECINTDHETPFGTVQNFTFCSFRKKLQNSKS